MTCAVPGAGRAAPIHQARGDDPAKPRVNRLRIPSVTSQPPSEIKSGAPLSVEADDASLVAVMDRGQPDASDTLAVLYERHGRACYRLARQITGNAVLAEDAVQEAFVGLWRSPGAYQQQRGSVRTWLLTMTHHKAVDLIRREAAEQRRQGAEARQAAVRPTSGADPATILWDEVRGAEVRAALRELPEPQRQAVALAYFGGYTQSQIAELTGVPLGTVKTRTFAAMRRLRGRLASLAISPQEESP
jgi:RNA polymerase sigma factor (sigma-70 family)